jgi:hypothetical protein
MILSAMGDDLKKLVVTEAHRRSVRAISKHSFVLLLGAPAAGKSTIGASLAVGAADIWQSFTLRATSPEFVEQHLNPHEKQFFWIDDAWGSTQYQRQTVEAWNKILPLIQSAVKRGTQFLLTSRDYIWQSALRDLKTQALPLLTQSQVVINVHDLSVQERAQILYNHLKLGDQPKSFRSAVKPYLAEIAAKPGFLPETARRFGSSFFMKPTNTDKLQATAFFESPKQFLADTISNLAPDCRSAIALVFIAGGRIPSPIPDGESLRIASDAFGATSASVKEAVSALNGSLLLLAHDEPGRYWTYKHPTVGDAYASLVAVDPELVEVYVRGAKAETLMTEVVCAGVTLAGAPVTVPRNLYPLLLERVKCQPDYRLKGFLSYRADQEFAKMILSIRQESWLTGMEYLQYPIADDPDASLLAQLHRFDLLPEKIRLNFVSQVRNAAIENADASFLIDDDLRAVLTEAEIADIMDDVDSYVLAEIPAHVDRIRKEWTKEYAPEDHFDTFTKAIGAFAAASGYVEAAFVSQARKIIRSAVESMEDDWEKPKEHTAPKSAATHLETSMAGHIQ